MIDEPETDKEDSDYEYAIKIKKVLNGYLLTGHFGEYTVRNDMVISERADETISENPELVAGYEMLWEVLEYFGLYGSKHDAERIRVVIVKREADE